MPQYSAKDAGLSVKQPSSTGLERYQGGVPKIHVIVAEQLRRRLQNASMPVQLWSITPSPYGGTGIHKRFKSATILGSNPSRGTKPCWWNWNTHMS
jgi:hypothetical protein